MFRKFTVILLAGLFLVPAPMTLGASAIKQNSTCTKLGKTAISAAIKYKCTKTKGKLIWKKISSVSVIETDSPGVKPDFTVQYVNGKVVATLSIPSPSFIVENKIESVDAVIYANKNSSYLKIGGLQYDFSTWDSKSGKSLNFTWDLKGDYVGSQLAVEARFINYAGQGEKALKAIFIPNVPVAPAPVPTATPAPVPTATPAPVPTATAEVGCSVSYLSPLPYASQRIALTSITWEKDSQGYLSAILTLRNDNSMSLRLVEFNFLASHKFSIVRFEQTLQGNNFFIKDDPKFNSTDGTPGAWASGQTRIFKVPSNQFLECRSISVLSSGFSVVRGIGE